MDGTDGSSQTARTGRSRTAHTGTDAGRGIHLKLVDLDGKFLKLCTNPGELLSYLFVETLAEATGVKFLCPKCFRDRGGPCGTHSVICWFVGVDPRIDPKPGRWQPSGTSLADLSFVAYPGQGNFSVELMSGCHWHGHLINGELSII